MIGVGVGPSILSPGKGPNGPGPIDMRRPVASVGWGSSVPYGPTNGYVSPNGVTGFVGPAADSLRRPTTFYCRIGGSNNNGGTSTSLTPERTGTDGTTTQNSTTFSSATGAFTTADVGKGICVGTGVNAYRFRIVAIISTTSVTLERQAPNNLNTQTWALGGAWADLRAPMGDTTVNANVTGACGVVNSGDIVYLGAGSYRAVFQPGLPWGTYRNNLNLGVNQSAEYNGQVNFIGDVDGSKTGDAGPVILTAYLTNDKTAPSATSLFTMNGRPNMKFSNLLLVNGTGAPAISSNTTGAVSQNITFQDCALFAGPTGVTAGLNVANSTVVGARAFNFLFDRCHFFGGTSATLTFQLQTGTHGGGDYDANILIRNCVFTGSGTKVAVTNNGTLTGNGGGVRVVGATSLGWGGSFMTTVALRNSTVFPCSVQSSFLWGTTVLNAGTAGQIVESNNLIVAATPRTNVSVGAGSVSDGSYATLLHMGQERIWGGSKRWLGEPMAGSPLLGFGGPDPLATNPTDLLGRNRPAGIASPLVAAGALERHNTWIKNTGTVRSGTNSVSVTGPGDQEWVVPVDAATVTISVYLRYDASYSGLGGLLPALQIDANPLIGVAAQTVYATVAGSGAWELVTLSAITPTAKGVVTVRVVSFDAGAGTAFADDFSIA